MRSINETLKFADFIKLICPDAEFSRHQRALVNYFSEHLEDLREDFKTAGIELSGITKLSGKRWKLTPENLLKCAGKKKFMIWPSYSVSAVQIAKCYGLGGTIAICLSPGRRNTDGYHMDDYYHLRIREDYKDWLFYELAKTMLEKKEARDNE